MRHVVEILLVGAFHYVLQVDAAMFALFADPACHILLLFWAGNHVVWYLYMLLLSLRPIHAGLGYYGNTFNHCCVCVREDFAPGTRAIPEAKVSRFLFELFRPARNRNDLQLGLCDGGCTIPRYNINTSHEL